MYLEVKAGNWLQSMRMKFLKNPYVILKDKTMTTNKIFETKHKITGHPVSRRIYDTEQERWITIQRYYNGEWIDVKP